MVFKFIYRNYIETITFLKKMTGHLFPKSKYYRKIQSWVENNKKRKFPKRYFVMRLEGEDANKNAIFASFKLGIKSHMIFRGYLAKIASLLPPSKFQRALLRVAGLIIDEDVFIAPEITIDVVLNGWTKFRKGSSIGIRVNCFNHLFEQNVRIILGYIDIGEGASIGGFTTISPGVFIGEKADIGAEVKIGPGVRIGKRTKIGPGVMISSFVSIGEGAVVKPGSVVLENMPSYTVVEGNPAKATNQKTRHKRPLSGHLVNVKSENKPANVI